MLINRNPSSRFHATFAKDYLPRTCQRNIWFRAWFYLCGDHQLCTEVKENARKRRLPSRIRCPLCQIRKSGRTSSWSGVEPWAGKISDRSQRRKCVLLSGFRDGHYAVLEWFWRNKSIALCWVLTMLWSRSFVVRNKYFWNTNHFLPFYAYKQTQQVITYSWPRIQTSC